MKEIDFGRMRALVVEDDQETRELIVAMLEGTGIGQIERARNGQAALNDLRDFDPDIILCDVLMEPMDGITFTRRLRTQRDSRNPHVPVILLTAHTDRTTVIEARDAGVNAFVAKPVSIDEMRRKIELVIKDPRRFIRSEDYVGPDRRRRDVPLAGRSDRRKSGE